VELERGWRRGDELLDLGRVEPDRAGRTVDHRAGGREGVERPVTEDLDADLGQDPERGVVDRLDLVGGQDLDRSKGIDEAAPREDGRPRRRTPGTPARPVAGRGGIGRSLLVIHGLRCYDRDPPPTWTSCGAVARRPGCARALLSCLSQTALAQLGSVRARDARFATDVRRDP